MKMRAVNGKTARLAGSGSAEAPFSYRVLVGPLGSETRGTLG